MRPGRERLRRQALCGVLMFSCAGMMPSVASPSAPDVKEIRNTEEFFPDEIGCVWRYVGRTRTETIERIADVTFTNEVSTVGTTNVRGMTVKIFRETNQANKGPTDEFFLRDKSGITYYGSQPTTPFEQQLVPYRVLKFPLALDDAFQQLNKKDLDMHTDLDGDGRSERGDVLADAKVVGYESVTVPAGTFPEALRIDAVMRISITLTKNRHVTVSTDRITSWFVRGVGLIKYIEEIEAPPVLETRGEVTYLTEELESYTIKGAVRDPSVPGLFSAHSDL